MTRPTVAPWRICWRRLVADPPSPLESAAPPSPYPHPRLGFGLQDKAFHGLTFTQEEAENVSTLFEAAGFKPRIAERTGQLNLERRPLLLKAPPQGLDRMTKVCYPKPEGGKDESLPLQLPPQPPPQPPPVDQAARDAAEKARKTSAALAAIDAEGADET